MPPSPDLRGGTLVALSHAAQNARIGAAVRRAGGTFIGLPALRLAGPDDPAAAQSALAAALAAPVCLFTSPAAVRAARRLGDLAGYRGMALAVGAGTAAALRRSGIARVQSPALMQSEGLLAMPALSPPPAQVGVVTAPGGRDMIVPQLEARGAAPRIAHVYRRQPGRLQARHAEAVRAASPPLILLLSSGEAFENALAQLPDDVLARLRDAHVVAASPRLRELARARGFTQVDDAGSARLSDLLATAAGHAKPDAFR